MGKAGPDHHKKHHLPSQEPLLAMSAEPRDSGHSRDAEPSLTRTLLGLLVPGGPRRGVHVTDTGSSAGPPPQIIPAEGRTSLAGSESYTLPPLSAQTLYFPHKVPSPPGSPPGYPSPLQSALQLPTAPAAPRALTRLPPRSWQAPFRSHRPAAPAASPRRAPPLSTSTCSRHKPPLGVP